MNWKSRDLLDEAKSLVFDEGVFSPDQIGLLIILIEKIGAVIEQEDGCASVSQSGGHGFN